MTDSREYKGCKGSKETGANTTGHVGLEQSTVDAREPNMGNLLDHQNLLISPGFIGMCSSLQGWSCFVVKVVYFINSIGQDPIGSMCDSSSGEAWSTA